MMSLISRNTNPRTFAHLTVTRLLLAKKEDGFYIQLSEKEAKSLSADIIEDVIVRCGDDGFLKEVLDELRK